MEATTQGLGESQSASYRAEHLRPDFDALWARIEALEARQERIAAEVERTLGRLRQGQDR